jgi:hypothetical protein
MNKNDDFREIEQNKQNYELKSRMESLQTLPNNMNTFKNYKPP